MLDVIQTTEYKTLSSGQIFKANYSDGICRVQSENDDSLILKAHAVDERLTLTVEKNDARENDEFLFVAVEYLLGHNPELRTVTIKGANKKNHPDLLLQKYFQKSQEDIAFTRGEFFQLGGSWYKERDQVVFPERYTETNGRVHPIRPDVQSGRLYSRYVPQIGKVLSFRVIDKDLDLDLFHGWHNQPRVAAFWEMAESKEKILAYIEKSLKDPHALPTIAECDGVPFGYFELYWTREDRLAPYYESEVWDRGFHFLVGEKSFLGFSNTDAILKSLTHFLYLEDRRTRKIMAEPRSDNQKVLRYLETFVAWKKLYEFDFPHKRSALLECTRERFFTGDFI